MQWKSLLLLFSGIAVTALWADEPGPRVPPDRVWRDDAPTTISVVVESSVRLEDTLLRSMERELQRVFAPSDTRIEMILPHGRDAHEVFDTEMLVMRVRGRCELGPMPPLNGHRPDMLGRTFVTDGVILPFVELDCKQISGALRQRLAGAKEEMRPVLLGRAMARVLAHEIYHVLARTSAHSPHGIAADTMNAEQLIGERMDFRYEDFERMGLLPSMGTH